MSIFGVDVSSQTKRQHYIPRVLLNRFASKNEGHKYWIWQISKQHEPKEVSTKDVGLGSWFYGKPGVEIEKSFMLIETKFSNILKDIDAGLPIDKLKDDLRWIVYTLTMRTRAIREHFYSAAASAFHNFKSSITSDKVQVILKTVFNQALSNDPESILSEIPEMLRPYAAMYLNSESFRDDIINHFTGDEAAEEATEYIREIIQEGISSGHMEKSMKEGHNRALAELLCSEDIPFTFNPNYWEIIETMGDRLILGDACVLARDADGDIGMCSRFGPDWNQLLFPLSPCLLLVAFNHRRQDIPESSIINQYMAQISKDYIFSDNIDPATRELAKVIGAGDALVTDEEIDGLPDNVWASMLDKDNDI